MIQPQFKYYLDRSKSLYLKMASKEDYFDKLTSEIICCLSTNSHIIEDCVLLKCGGHSCRKCTSATEPTSTVKCNHCSNEYELNKDFENNCVDIKSTMNLLISSNYAEIFESLTKRFKNKQERISTETKLNS